MIYIELKYILESVFLEGGSVQFSPIQSAVGRKGSSEGKLEPAPFRAHRYFSFDLEEGLLERPFED